MQIAQGHQSSALVLVLVIRCILFPYIIQFTLSIRHREKKRNMLLVQLSDLHIGRTYFRQEVFDTIVYEVKNKLKPDVILITGDLTDEGLVSQFRRASIEIKKLAEVALKS